MGNKIQVIEIELEEMIGSNEVAEALGIDYREALALMKNQVIPSRRLHGLYTLKSVLKKNVHKLARQS